MTNPAVPNRDHQHGGLDAVGITSQQIKDSMREGINWKTNSLHSAAKESLDMIAHKIARVLSGHNPHDFQHWEDIAGYATAFMRTWSEREEEMVDSTPLQTRQGPPIAFDKEVSASMEAALLNGARVASDFDWLP
jgi:hypothetical protein